MSLDVVRDGALASRKHDLVSAIRSQSASLLALHAVTTLLSNNAPISSLLNCKCDPEIQSALDSDQAAWLKSNSLRNGRRFDDASLPRPSPHQDAPAISPAHHSTAAASSIESLQGSARAHASAPDATLTSHPDDSTPADSNMAVATARQPASLLKVAADADAASLSPGSLAVASSAPPARQRITIPMADVAPPEPSEEAEFDAAAQRRLRLESPKRPAKTVHLPPENVQEARLREAAEDKARPSSSDTDKPHHPAGHFNPHLQTELASSPSSTVGAYSANTPMPPQESPDTSPDSETANVRIPPELRPTPEEQHAKDEHDRHLNAQKAIAHQEALGDVNTPDDQLRWEEREAAAREAEERLARDGLNGPEPPAKAEAHLTEAEALVEELQAEVPSISIPSEHGGGTVTRLADNSLSVAITEDRTAIVDDDEDNITVTPRVKLPHPRPVVTVQSPTQTPVDWEAASEMHAPSANQALSKASSQTPALEPTPRPTGAAARQIPALSRRRSSIEAVSPLTTRRPDSSSSVAFTSPNAPKQSLPPQPSSQTSPTPDLSLVDLSSLKGAAEDPDRDYLEPLFKIQAYDSPNITTNPLPELIRSASKTVSTNDQFVSMHERMDYRILRRIYHLQNANKWSLRQMDKCKEPDQPVTHHDRMMAEMKWMCKDFRAERRRKMSVCAWLAQRCAEWVAADPDEKSRLQVNAKPPQSDHLLVDDDDDDVPELDTAGESPHDENGMPSTPDDREQLPTRLLVHPDLLDSVMELQRHGSLLKALKHLPTCGLPGADSRTNSRLVTSVSKFVKGKVLPKLHQPLRKRSRYDYDDELAAPADSLSAKRPRIEQDLQPEDPDVAIFHPDNKPIRDRLHAQNAFRPPSEFQMPSVPFYEFRNGSQWIVEDDQRLRKLARDYTFNWSIISDQLSLPSLYKSGMERRTPWECFERWVDLEQMPAEMRKTVYFKTWYSRLEQSQQAVEKRFQAQVAVAQAQAAQNGVAPQHQPIRRRTLPTRVEKRKNTRYLWTVDAMRKNAKKRELAASKQAEATRAAAQRKAAQQNDPQQPRQPMLTPQQFSQKRYERDLQVAEMQRVHRQKLIEAQQRQAQMARAAAQQGLPNGVVPQQRPGSSNNAAHPPQNHGQLGQPGHPQQQLQQQHHQQQQQQQQHQQHNHPNVNNAQMSAQQRQSLPLTTRNGHLAVPQVSNQGVPQAQMQAAQNAAAAQHPNMQRMAAQVQAQARNGQFPSQQQQKQFQTQNPNMVSPGNGSMTTQQQLASNQALLAAFQAQQQQQQQHNNNNQQGHNQSPQTQNPQMASSPSMGPPPTPANMPQQLSSGHVPAVIAIKNHLRASYPNMSEEQLQSFATERLKSQSSNQVRQNAMNAAAGINPPPSSSTPNGNNMQAYSHNQVAFQNNASSLPNGNAATYGSPDGGANQTNNLAAAAAAAAAASNGGGPNGGGSQHSYAQMMRQRQMAQMRLQQQSPNSPHAMPGGGGGGGGGSPGLGHASSPSSMTPVASPSMQYSTMNNMGASVGINGGGVSGGGSGGGAAQRPPSRSNNNTPQMQRLGSSGGVPGVAVSGMQSPGAQSGALQGSPRGMQASMAR